MAFRKYSPLFMILVLMFVLAACDKAPEPTTTAVPTEPPITAEYLYAKLAENAEETPITGAEYEQETDLTMTFSSLNTSSTISMGTMGTMTYSPEQDIRYTEADVGTSITGQLTTEEVEEYTVTEDGKSVIYSHNKTTDTWTQQESGGLMSCICEATITPASLTLEEATQTVANREVYVLQASFSGDALEPYLGSTKASLLDAMGAEAEDTEVDMSAVTGTATYYIATDTLLLVQVEASVDGLGEALSELFVEAVLASLEEEKDSMGAAYSEMVKMYKQLKISIPLHTFTYTNISYEPATVPELPADAKEAAALQEYDPLQADGSYLLKEVGVSALVKVPEGWTATSAAYYVVEFVSPDENSRLAVFLLANSTEDDVQDILDSTVALIKENGIYSSHALNDEVNGWQTATITIDRNSHTYMAWKELKENLWILVEYIDFTGASMGNTLLPQLETIEITVN